MNYKLIGLISSSLVALGFFIASLERLDAVIHQVRTPSYFNLFLVVGLLLLSVSSMECHRHNK